MALFQCYMEQAIEPHLENLSKEEYKEYYKKLLYCGVKFNTLFADQYEPQIKGLHFNDALSKGNSIVFIHEEVYKSMNEIVDI